MEKTVSWCLIPLSCRFSRSPGRMMLLTFRIAPNFPATRVLSLLLLAIVLAMTGCRKDKEFDDERSAAELYTDAKRALDNSSWEQAIQTYKYLQTRYPFGRYTEQSMLDLSYAYFKA